MVMIVDTEGKLPKKRLFAKVIKNINIFHILGSTGSIIKRIELVFSSWIYNWRN